MCAFALTALSIRVPDVVHPSQWLPFTCSDRYTEFALRKLSAPHVLQLRKSARRRNPRSLTSKPADCLTTLVSKRVIPPPYLPNLSCSACPNSDVRVGSTS